MNQKTFRTHLLSFGMILFSLTVAACLINVLFFHYARGLHSMTLLLTVIIFAVYTLLLFSLSRFLKHADTDKLEHCAAWLVPAFLLVSFVLMLLCGFWLAHKPFCDNAFVLHGADISSAELSPFCSCFPFRSCCTLSENALAYAPSFSSFSVWLHFCRIIPLLPYCTPIHFPCPLSFSRYAACFRLTSVPLLEHCSFSFSATASLS